MLHPSSPASRDPRKVDVDHLNLSARFLFVGVELAMVVIEKSIYQTL